MITLPDGSGVLICPTGAGFGTVSDERFLELESSISGTLQEISVSVFQEWFSNAKEIKLSVEEKYEPDQFGRSQSYVENYKQGVYYDYGEGEFGVDFNDSPHPFPSMSTDIYEGGALASFISSLTFGRVFGYFVYDGSAISSDYISYELPFIFVYNDRFYWYYVDPTDTVTTLTETERKYVLNYTYQEADPDDPYSEITVEYTQTVIYQITKRFY